MPTIKKTKVEFEGQIEEREVIVEEEKVTVWPQGAELNIVTKPVARVDGHARVTGQAIYTRDLNLPGMLIGRFLRSPHPHARIVSIDSSEAETLPGVWLIWHMDQQPPVTGLAGKDIFRREITKQGQEIAFVAASDQRIADDALKLIRVEYEELPFAHDLDSATAEDAPAVFADETDNWIDPEGRVYERGDVDAGFQEADVVVEATFTTPMASHCCLETHGSAAQWEGDQLTVWHSTQSVFGTRSSMAEALGVPQDKVRAICEYVGGGFGSKWGTESYTLMAALAARETNRPVKAVLDRQEEHLVAGYRAGTKQTVKLGAQRDGTLTAMTHLAWATTGDYGNAGSIFEGPTRDLYVCPNVRAHVWAARTNMDNSRAFRAPGYLEGTVALEGAMDELAAALDMDPLALRLHNYAETSPQRNIPYTFKGLREAYERGAQAMDWANRASRKTTEGPWRRGFGMASQIWGGGGGPPANAIIKMLPDGTAEVLAGVQDLGTGTKTVIAQVAAEELGFDLESVRVVIGDSLPTPFGPGSGGSVTLASITPAIRSAARDAKEQFLDLAAFMLDVPDAAIDELEIKDGRITYLPDPGKAIDIVEVAAKMGNYMIIGRGARGPNPDDKALNTFGAQFAEVEVNVETGQVRLIKLVASHAIGRVVNPMTAESQVYGGLTMGLGFGIMEERIIDAATGLQLTTNLEDYKPPTIKDIPELIADFVDTVDEQANSVGGKGLGEPPIIPTPAAIANAVADAIGVRVTDLPITPHRVLEALRAREERA